MFGGNSRMKPTGWLAIVALVLVIIMIAFPFLPGNGHSGLRGPSASPSFQTDLADLPTEIHFSLVADLDKKSRDAEAKHWKSVLKTGTLRWDGTQYTASWDREYQLASKHVEGERGMELSELQRFNDRLYTFDDRSGIVFEIINSPPEVVPRFILMEGDGNTDKGFKCEWATVKDGQLVVGSFGKEFTDEHGNILNTNNNWIKTIDPEGRIAHVDWNPYYDIIRKKMGHNFPGYIIHEAVLWSPTMRRWLLFPRRVSKEKYDDVADEKRGTNIVYIADATFSDVIVKEVITLIPLRGFSSVKEVPSFSGKPTHTFVGVRSMENSEAGTQSAFLSVFTLDGRMLMQEIEIPGAKKYVVHPAVSSAT